jgi:hypothetical protein
MVLPDPAKSYDGSPIIAALWAQFTEALRRAQRVLIVGHSLNDAGLVRALQENVSPSGRIGITWLPDPDHDTPPAHVQALTSNELDGAMLFPLLFKDPLEPKSRHLDQWLEHLQSLGPRG